MSLRQRFTSSVRTSWPAAGLRATPTGSDTVEINNPFYRLPEEGTFAVWALPAKRRHAMEVRDPSWYNDETLSRWAAGLAEEAQDGRAICAHFNNSRASRSA